MVRWDDMGEELPGQQQQQEALQQTDVKPDLALVPSEDGRQLQPGDITEVTNETPTAARGELYSSQACLFVTTRILVVDFLNRRLLPTQARDHASCFWACQMGPLPDRQGVPRSTVHTGLT